MEHVPADADRLLTSLSDLAGVPLGGGVDLEVIQGVGLRNTLVDANQLEKRAHHLVRDCPGRHAQVRA